MALQSMELKRQKRIAEWETRIQLLHNKFPRLEEISRLYARLSLELVLVEMGNGKMGMSRQDILKTQESLVLERKSIIANNNLPENIYDVWWDCEKCKDTGFLGPGLKCSCRIQEEIKARWQTSGLSPEQERQTFGTFSLEWYQDKERHRQILEKCVAFAEKVCAKQPVENLFLYGPVGTGKTHLCSSIANYVLQAGINVIYIKISQLLDLIREYKFSREWDEQGQQQKLKTLYRVDLLIIDDLGTETSTDFVREQLLLLLDERNNYRLPWVISTNLTPNEIGTMYEDRLSDRMLATSQILKFTGESVRRQKKIMRK
ncbi:MAG: ATP-binding protein [Peptococcaceae bacterium]|jgi:DNA replication protein DnaC|nr:ATP-binding protein [Peptococcaceae bacterium]MDH7525568.1 ATP-binding protein [Peptococcaceae bacterium]